MCVLVHFDVVLQAMPRGAELRRCNGGGKGLLHRRQCSAVGTG